MRTIILDDEAPAIQILSTFVKKIPFLNLELATTNAFEALERLNQGEIDLLFLDIEMPDITGLELLKTLSNPPMVIFTTAYEQYALEGFELDIVDYLLKPIRFERFLKAVNKAQRFAKPKKDKSSSIQVKVEYQTVNILLENILYIESLKDYVRIHTPQKRIVTRLNLKGILSLLPLDEFIRIHRSYIIAKSKINSFTKTQVSIQNTKIPIGESYQMTVANLLK